ncbi:hypothetical protein K2Z83_12870 [Oscillochloris sp. ZM17-4]|uniref:hypothetical protein n=1 Tax=Oscillochloris sp. ZM17-4 TaxID=2866714 RepID=UPI001C735E63|nr:hypothetical protein [Oscillochloris sp. ZM17-4]MBX0328570.1 hypothetical protein [Oscillochloris sp. ZM17-4]
MPKKARPAAQPNPAVRLSNLRPRLVQRFAEPGEMPALWADLDRLTGGLKPASFLPILAAAFAATPDLQREQIDAPVGAWLRERGLLDALRGLLPTWQHGLASAAARAWLEAGGITPPPELTLTAADLLVDAYEVRDPSQASVALFWYEDARRRRVRATAFLIDFEPPWEGALKDVAHQSFRSIDHAHSDFFSVWQEDGLQQRPIDKADATQHVWAAIRQSQAQGIRLPADFIPLMSEVMPVLPGVPSAYSR